MIKATIPKVCNDGRGTVEGRTRLKGGVSGGKLRLDRGRGGK